MDTLFMLLLQVADLVQALILQFYTWLMLKILVISMFPLHRKK
jgi:hypothetical protein